MSRWLAVGVLAVALSSAAGAAGPATLPGGWKRLPDAPAAAALSYTRVGVWTGKRLIVFGRAGTPGAMRNVAFSYDPVARRWRTLAPPAGDPGSYEGATSAVWTGKQVLVWGPMTLLSYEPATNRWRQLPRSPLSGAPPGLVVWTGRELIGWGGGCCGDASADGVAYDPATRRWRTLAKAPVAGQQRPVGAWTGRELVVLPGRGPDGRRTGGAAYDPAKDTWRRIASPPQERIGATAVWDGRELLVVGGSGPPDPKTGTRKLVSVPFAYDAATNRWRTLPGMDGGRYGRDRIGAVWTGGKLLLWGGETQAAGRVALAPHGLAFDPKTGRWYELPGAPLLGRLDPVAVWTGKALLVWGGEPLRQDVPQASDWWPFLDAAAFVPS